MMFLCPYCYSMNHATRDDCPPSYDNDEHGNMRECINDDGSLRLDAARSQFVPVADARDAVTILAAVDSAIAKAEGR